MGHRYDKMKALKGPKQTEPYVFFFYFSSVEIGFYICTLLKIENIQKGLTLPKSIIVSLTANVF